MTATESRKLVKDCSFHDYTFHIREGLTNLMLQASYAEADTITGKTEEQFTRLWDVTGCTKSELVATCFKCVLTSMEHRTREWFLYRNRAIYQPHYDVDALHNICEERQT